MTEDFDPYYKWLGIPADEQPPHHYRLLGVKLFETDADVVSHACDQRMSHLRSFSGGPHAPLAQRLLNEVAAARICLLDAEKKADYDDILRATLPARDAGIKDALPPGTADIQAGMILAEYELIELISRGKSGEVWKARHRRMGRDVALKLLPPAAAQHPEVVKRFQREVKVAARLKHPNLVAAFDAGQYRGVHFLVLEQVEKGADLASVVQRHGPLSVEKANDYLCQAARGLSHLHGEGVFHRNIKPANLLVDDAGTLRISNLILARIDDAGAGEEGVEALTIQGQIMGTVDYMPPEQAMDAHCADQRSDIYALGCTWFFLLTGQPPYPAKSAMKKLLAHRQQSIPNLRQHCPAASEKMQRIFERTLAKNPADRYQSAAQLMNEFEPESAGGFPWPIAVAGAISVGILLTIGIVVLLLYNLFA